MSDTCDECDKWPTDKPVLIDGGILCVDCAGRRIAAIDKDNDRLMKKIAAVDNLARWRKWPEEKPEAGKKYMAIWFDDVQGLWIDEPHEEIHPYDMDKPLEENLSKFASIYWRPIGPLPGGE